MYRSTEPRTVKQEEGAAAVEFAFALLALFLFFAIFMQFVQFFIAKERLALAGFTAARTYAVEGDGPARQVAVDIDPDASVSIGNEINLTREIQVPEGIRRFLFQSERGFIVRHTSPAFREPEYSNDDNQVSRH